MYAFRGHDTVWRDDPPDDPFVDNRSGRSFNLSVSEFRGPAHTPPKTDGWHPRLEPTLEYLLDRRRAFRRLLGADALRYWFTGAVSDGGIQTDPDASLGGFRAATEARRVGMVFRSPIPGLRILFAARANGAAGTVGNLQARDGGRLVYSAPDGSPGPVVTINNGETRTLWDGVDSSRWIRVLRTSDNPLAGSGQVEFVDVFNDVFGLANALEAESSAGGNRYRAVMLRAQEPVADVRLFIETLATGAITSVGLPGAGAGTITTVLDAFRDWPQRGWCRVEILLGGGLRENVYYSSRTNSVLTVPAFGRGRLGTVAAAGVAFDAVRSIPGIRIGFEAPVANAIQTIANESTAPIGITWSTEVTAAAGLAPGSLVGDGKLGLWIHRELPAGVSAFASHANKIRCQFLGADGVNYHETLAGLYRIADDDLERYELHQGIGAEPDLSLPPAEVFTSLPHVTTLILAVNTTNYLVTNFRNRHDLRSESKITTIIRIDGAGDRVAPLPHPPQVTFWSAGASGVFVLRALYFYELDRLLDETDEAAAIANMADQFLIYARYDGSDPDPGVDTPVIVDLVKADGAAKLIYSSAVQPPLTTGKVIVRTRRTLTPPADSDNSDIHTAVNNDSGGSSPAGGAFWRQIAEQEQ